MLLFKYLVHYNIIYYYIIIPVLRIQIQSIVIHFVEVPPCIYSSFHNTLNEPYNIVFEKGSELFSFSRLDQDPGMEKIGSGSEICT